MWIQFCISTVKFSILVNRSLVGFFSPQKGLRQGDPISPFLLKTGRRAKELEWIQSFQVGRNPTSSVNVSHLLYADDTLIFCGAERSQVTQLDLTLLLFEALSGLHINMLKSIMYNL